MRSTNCHTGKLTTKPTEKCFVSKQKQRSNMEKIETKDGPDLVIGIFAGAGLNLKANKAMVVTISEDKTLTYAEIVTDLARSFRKEEHKYVFTERALMNLSSIHSHPILIDINKVVHPRGNSYCFTYLENGKIKNSIMSREKAKMMRGCYNVLVFRKTHMKFLSMRV